MKSKSDPEFLNFAIENFSEMIGYIAQGNLNIRFTRKTARQKDRRVNKMWFGVRREAHKIM